jgi:glycine hydroxymethyltransferase
MEKLKDIQIQKTIDLEYDRQQNELELIASENYVSKEVMKSCANIFTNKYSE